MINIYLRDKNNLINITNTGKTPIRGKTSSNLYFHTPLELLLSALGLCVGGIINNYCKLYDINPQIFESISVDKNDKYIISIQRPEDFEVEHIKRLSSEIDNCNVARELKTKVEVNWLLNKTKIEELIKEQEKSCCGS